MSIIVNNITKLYGQQKALDNVSFEVKAGEVVGFLGPNGAGKSTMMKILSCFIPQSAGDASVCGHDVMQDSMLVRKKLGYLPENNPLYLDMYVREFLFFIAGIHHIEGNVKKRVDEIIAIVGLGAEQNKKLGALSKGFRQRAGLAQAMIHNPEVLILDEPTSGLDPNQLLDIRNLIRDIGKEKTVMLSTHIMQEVEAVCDRVIIINKGIIVADDLTTNLQGIARKKEMITVEFDGKAEIEQLKKLDGVLKVILMKENTYQVEAAQGKDIRKALFNFAVDNKLSILSQHREESSLEDVFRSLTKE
ncbi:MAG: gliding motility-associated ABC transporter ATP-binding subunit GldA [Bacteroidota bacterium]